MRLRFKRVIRHAHGETVRPVLRFASIACIVALAVIAVGEALRTDVTDRAVAPSAPTNDPLAADLARCRDVTAEQFAADNTCRRVWAENRRRFFSPAAPAGRPSDTPPKIQETIPTCATSSPSDEAR